MYKAFQNETVLVYAMTEIRMLFALKGMTERCIRCTITFAVTFILSKIFQNFVKKQNGSLPNETVMVNF